MSAHASVNTLELARRPLADGEAWLFPRRKLPGVVRLIGVGITLTPIPVLGIVLGVTNGLRAWASSAISPQHATLGAIAVTTIVAVVVVFLMRKIVRFGLAMAFGRSEIRARQGALEVTERVGPLLWTKRIPADEIDKVFVRMGDARVNGKHVNTGMIGRLSKLATIVVLHAPEGGETLAALGYPPSLCQQAVHEAGARLGVPYETDPEIKILKNDDGPDTPGAEPSTPAPPVASPPVPLPRPAGSKAAVEVRDTPAGIERTITLPPMGLRKGGKGTFGFAVMWLSFCTVFFSIFLGTFFGGASKLGVLPGLGLLAFATVFIGIGVWMLVHSISLGRRHAVIDIVGDAVLVSRVSPFSKKMDQWTADQITRVRVGPTGTAINDVPVMELQIFERLDDGSEREVGLFAERPNAELHWLVSELQSALVVPAHETGPLPATP